MREVDGSNREVFRPVSAKIWCGWSVVITAWCLLGGASNVRAAGCHVSVRPVLTSTLSWESKLAADLSATAPALAPVVLTHPPCQGEFPRVLEPVDGAVAVAARQWIAFDIPGRPDTIVTGSAALSTQPPGMRLDRPPRLDQACRIIATTA
jgi:hypothetical protein